MRKKILSLVLIAGVSLFLVGCTTQNSNATGNQNSSNASINPETIKNVSIEDMSFNPTSLDIKVGDTVKWTNNDSVAHTVVRSLDDANDFASQTLNPGDTYTHTFNEPGSYAYHCSIHTEMIGQITVSAE